MVFNVQRYYLCFPGMVLGLEQLPAPSLPAFVANHSALPVPERAVYGPREQTRREHLRQPQAAFDVQPLDLPHERTAGPWLTEAARQTDKGVALVRSRMGHLRRQKRTLVDKTEGKHAW